VPFCANSICNLHFFPFQFCGSAIFAFIAALIARAKQLLNVRFERAVGIYNSLMVKNAHLWCKMASVLLMLAGPTDLDTQSIKIKKKKLKE